MHKYEYRVLKLGQAHAQQLLNEYGSQGWRLVSAEYHPQHMIAVLEREIRE